MLSIHTLRPWPAVGSLYYIMQEWGCPYVNMVEGGAAGRPISLSSCQLAYHTASPTTFFEHECIRTMEERERRRGERERGEGERKGGGERTEGEREGDRKEGGEGGRGGGGELPDFDVLLNCERL